MEESGRARELPIDKVEGRFLNSKLKSDMEKAAAVAPEDILSPVEGFWASEGRAEEEEEGTSGGFIRCSAQSSAPHRAIRRWPQSTGNERPNSRKLHSNRFVTFSLNFASFRFSLSPCCWQRRPRRSKRNRRNRRNRRNQRNRRRNRKQQP